MTTDRRGETEISANGELDGERLQAWLRNHVDGFEKLDRIEKFPGGQSNPTYRLIDGPRSYVLRRKPFGDLLPSAHAVDREHRLITALHPTNVPVAQPIALCEDQDVIGVTFYVMEMVVGRTFWDGALPDLGPSERRQIYREMIDVLARLHAVDPEAVGLGDFGRPGNYFERQVGRWTKQYRASQTEEIPEVERLIDWLPKTLPTQDRVSIIHGDYRIDNLIFATDTPSARAVIDWELSTLGDPLADFAYLVMNWTLPRSDRAAQLGGLDLEALGIPSLEDTTAHYCELTGRESIPSLEWYFSYNLFRLVGILQGVKKRHLQGNASSADAESKIARITPLAEQAWAFAVQAGA